ncbi:Crp/Fnr family transcriptional regulator [Paenibacillus sp. NPDC058071]|uniref:Crp/Fnr family transcriptional regulator n=1 Tax=Paenibacillus sp. NPDC058071 TaxID=3346326 RepID=UPI0036DB29A7
MTLQVRQSARTEWNLGASHSAKLINRLLELSPGSFTYKPVKAGQLLYREGAPCCAVYCICSGSVKLRKTSSDGKSLLLTIAGPGEIVGEMQGDPDEEPLFHFSSAQAAQDTIVAILYHTDFDMLVAHDAEAAYLFGKAMAGKRRIAESKLRDLVNAPKLTALSSCLLRLGNSFGVTSSTGVRIDVKLTHSELGEMIGATRESVNRLLAALKEQGTIGASRGRIVIQREQDLRQIAGCPDCPGCPAEVCRI